MEKKKIYRLKHIAFGSNAVRLSLRELAVVLVAVLTLMLFVLPLAWRKLEKVKTGRDFRIAYDYRDDYWVFRQWVDDAVKSYPAVFIGDSVIWGMYVDNSHTLSALLNRKLHSETVANLAIDGLHSVAQEGLLRYYASSIRDKDVILHFNPLWLNSKKYDLSTTEEMNIHHPRLIPQFSPSLHCYNEKISGRMSVLLERNIPFYSMLNHLRLNYFNNEELAAWVIANPRKNPLRQLSLQVDPGEKKHVNNHDDWQKRGITAQDWKWVPLNESRQWHAFLNVVDMLRERHNRVMVMVGPINPYMLTPDSLAGLRRLQNDIKTQLAERKLSYFMVPDLPSGDYADASHPLADGYARIAAALAAQPFWKKSPVTPEIVQHQAEK